MGCGLLRARYGDDIFQVAMTTLGRGHAIRIDTLDTVSVPASSLLLLWGV
jgi:hypothetical protein